MGQEVNGEKKRLAFVLSGGVALGVYEAGVIYELLHAMEDQARSGHSELCIDVVVGASAGAITGALLSYILVTGAEKDLLYRAWVKSFNFHRFNKSGRESLVDGTEIRNMLRELMTVEKGNPNRYGPREEILLTIALTNLDGTKYLIRPSQDGEGIETFSFADKIRFSFRPGERRNPRWDKVIEGVQASAAYPVFFAPVKISRHPQEYPPWLNLGKTSHPEYWFADGGIIDNRPLGLAIDGVLRKKLAPGEERYFILVEPDPPEAGIKPKERYTMLDTAAAALWHIPRYDSLYRELAQLAEINRRVRWLEKIIVNFAPWLGEQLAQMEKDDFQNLLILLREECLKVAREVTGSPPNAPRAAAARRQDKEAQRYLELDLDRITRQRKFQGLVIKGRIQGKTPPGGEEDPDRFEELAPYLIFILEHLGGLSRKVELKVEKILPANPREELAGEFLVHFGGVFDERLREHDFRAGRRAGRQWLEKKGIKYCPDPKEAYQADPKLADFSWADIPPAMKLEAIFFAIKAFIRFLATVIGAFLRG